MGIYTDQWSGPRLEKCALSGQLYGKAEGCSWHSSSAKLLSWPNLVLISEAPVHPKPPDGQKVRKALNA